MMKLTKRTFLRQTRGLNVAGAIVFFALHAASLLPSAAHAGPGAHGPDGQHLDGPVNVGSGAGASPRVEAKTDLFELVGKLGGGEFSILIDRFSTNEPLLNAKVEVEFGSLKAAAKFHPDIGDYGIDDAAFLKAISRPGVHALVFTVVAGEESDLLDGTLTVGTAQDGDAHSHGQSFLGIPRSIFIGAGVTGLLLIGGVYVRRRMKRKSMRTYAGSR